MVFLHTFSAILDQTSTYFFCICSEIFKYVQTAIQRLWTLFLRNTILLWDLFGRFIVNFGAMSWTGVKHCLHFLCSNPSVDCAFTFYPYPSYIMVLFYISHTLFQKTNSILREVSQVAKKQISIKGVLNETTNRAWVEISNKSI